jgi:Mlc titration factor MtfA (ptsG expression regulator)
MPFSWLKDERRRWLLSTPFPPEWLGYLHANVALYAPLAEGEKARLRDDLRVLVDEKYWEGCRGLAVTDEMKVTIAAQACLLLLGMGHDYFGRVWTVLVYPSGFRVAREDLLREGLVPEPVEPATGVAHDHGPVILAWDQVLHESRHPEEGRNVVLHEFAHQLDFLDGETNGVPALADAGQERRWRGVMEAEFNKLLQDLERGRDTVLDPYASQDPAEFFAVATECFFTRPAAMRRRHPLLYEVLRDYYGQDPARRSGPAAPA